MASTHYKLMDALLDDYYIPNEEFGWADMLDALVQIYELREHIPHRTTVARFIASRVKLKRIKVVNKKTGCIGAKYKINFTPHWWPEK